ncbi:hypothetical protein Tco_1322437, partial [Tanacetum coccineum]
VEQQILDLNKEFAFTGWRTWNVHETVKGQLLLLHGAHGKPPRVRTKRICSEYAGLIQLGSMFVGCEGVGKDDEVIA